MKKATYISLGCKVNQYECDGLKQALSRAEFMTVSPDQAADVVVINTCTVTAEAERKSRQLVRKMKRKNPQALIVAMGCMTELATDFDEANITVGTRDRMALVDRICRHQKIAGCQMPMVPAINKYEEYGSVISRDGARAYVKIQDGCNQFCSYCIIPTARGRARSRDEQAIYDEAISLAKEGFREIVITGIHICSYQRENGGDIMRLADLFFRLASIEGICRIRLGSIEPGSISRPFLMAMKRNAKICPHFHLSLQSGSDTVLKRMNRTYTTRDYQRAVELVREIYPRAAISTDIIVGFPAESESEHIKSFAFCKKMAFSRIHVFPFSVRTGTAAADMTPLVPHALINERKRAFLSLADRTAENYAQSWIGQIRPVLLEAYKDVRYYEGYTPEYVRVRVACRTANRERDIVPVKITGARQSQLLGTIENEI